MTGELGGSQLSSLLEAVPGLASVLRSPVADAMVNMIRAGAGLGEFRLEDARELVQYATRRGLIPTSEGTRLLEEVEGNSGGKGTASKAKPKAARRSARTPASPKTKKATKAAGTKLAKKTARKVAKVNPPTKSKKNVKKKAVRPESKAPKKKAKRR